MKQVILFMVISLFALTNAIAANSASTLNGSWMSQDSNQISQSTLTVSNTNSKGFDFHFVANNGANTGDLENKAVFVGKDAIFKDTQLDPSSKTSCTIKFQFHPSAITVTTNQACDYYAGNGVSFDGKYIKNSKEKVLSLVDFGLLSNAKQQEDFKNLTGQDYQVFVNNCGNVVSEAQQSVEPKALYKEAFMRGLATEMACIIMLNEKNIWAAVIDTNQNTIKYFSNDPNYKNKLPKAIQDWVDSMNKDRSNPLTIKFTN